MLVTDQEEVNDAKIYIVCLQYAYMQRNVVQVRCNITPLAVEHRSRKKLTPRSGSWKKVPKIGLTA